MGDTTFCGSRMLPFEGSTRRSTSFLPSPFLFQSFLLFLIPPSYSLLEWPRRGAAGRPGRRLRGGGGEGRGRQPPYSPRTLLGGGSGAEVAAPPEASPGSPAPRPACPNLRRAERRAAQWCRSFAAAAAADAEREEGGTGALSYGRPVRAWGLGHSHGSGRGSGLPLRRRPCCG